jgi:hypothetical protein
MIAFFAMQVGAHPTPLWPLILLRRFVRLRPIALGVPPQSSEGEERHCEPQGGLSAVSDFRKPSRVMVSLRASLPDYTTVVVSNSLRRRQK